MVNCNLENLPAVFKAWILPVRTMKMNSFCVKADQFVALLLEGTVKALLKHDFFPTLPPKFLENLRSLELGQDSCKIFKEWLLDFFNALGGTWVG